MADIPQCVITATADSISGQIDGLGELTGEPLKGVRVTLTTNIPLDELISLGGELHAITEVEAFFDSDGILRPVLDIDAPGVTVPAEDPVWGLAVPVQITVDFGRYYLDGQSRSIKPWVFDAPLDGETKDLSSIPRVIGMDAVGVLRGPGVDHMERQGDDLVSFVQGVEVGRVDISDLEFSGSVAELSDAGTTGVALVQSEDQAAAWAALGDVPEANLPDLSLITFKGHKADEAEMLATTGEQGDWVIRDDSATVWVITASNPTLLTSWTQWPYPAPAWSGISGKPAFIAAGATAEEAREVIDAAPSETSNSYRRARGFADTNGVDDAAAIQAVFAEHVSGDFVIRSGQSLLVDCNPTTGGIFPPGFNFSDSRLVIEEGATLQVKTNGLDLYRLINLDASQNVTIENDGVLLGDALTHTGVTGQYGHLVVITNGAANIRLIGGGKVKEAWGDGVYMGGGTTSVNYDVLIDGWIADDCRREAFAPFWVDGCEITARCKIFGGPAALIAPVLGNGIDCEPNDGQWVTDLTIGELEIEGLIGNGIYISPLPIVGTPYVRNLKIYSPRVKGCGTAPTVAGHGNNIYIRKTDDLLLVNPWSVDAGAVGDATACNIRLNDIPGAVVKGGTLEGANGEGLYATQCPDLEVDGVTARNNHRRGINVDQSDQAKVHHCDLTDNLQDNIAGSGHLRFTDSSNALASRNTFKGTLGGAWVSMDAACSDVSVKDNTGLGAAPPAKIIDLGSNNRESNNHRVDVGVYEPWSANDRIATGVVDLGAASDATLSRIASGRFAVEGVEVITATAMAAATGKTTPVDADLLALFDSAAGGVLKALSMANLKALLYAYLVGAAPVTMDTLDEIAQSLGDNPDFAGTMTTLLAAKAPLVFAALAELHFTGSGSNVARLYNTTNDRMTIRSSGANGFAVVNAANNAELFKVFDNGTITHTGKITPRQTATATATSLTPSADTTDLYAYTALATALTINAPTGSPAQGQQISYRIRDNGVSQTLTLNAIFRAVGVVIPTATQVGKTLYIDTVYNSTETKWDVVRVVFEGTSSAWTVLHNTINSAVTLGSTANTEYVYYLNSGALPTLPTAVGSTNPYHVCNLTGSAIPIATTSSQQINGAASPFSLPAGSSVTLRSDNTGWRIF